jgi:Fe-S-cluster-containing dehydrogenase component/anaerobic selenocysteine-containing dehydrogenase
LASLNRRNFLKAVGVTGSATAVSACGLDDNRYYTPIEQILPYVVRPEQVTPGTPTFFATTVTTGPHAHAVTARHRDGRVINVGANEQFGMSRAVPTAALLELQRHYSPDRFQTPNESGAELDWDTAINKVLSAYTGAKSAGKKVAYLGPYRSGSIVKLLNAYTDNNAVFWEPLGYAAEADAAEKLFGQRALPEYALSSADFILSFGADFLSGWGGTQLASNFAEARNPNIGHQVARYALVSPLRGQTGANADDWHGCNSGSEAGVALAIAKLVAEKKGYTGPLRGLLGSADPAKAAQDSGLALEVIQGLAANIAAASASAILPGGVAGNTGNATDLALATYALNVVAGNVGNTFNPLGYAGPIHGNADVQRLISEMNAGNIGLLLIDDVNPAFSLPGAAFAEAMSKVGLSVALSSHPDETTATAKLVLPVADLFEDWGDEQPSVGLNLLRQPAMSPLYQSRSLGDILLAGLNANGANLATSWRDYLQQNWLESIYPAPLIAPTQPLFEDVLNEAEAAEAEGAEAEATEEEAPEEAPAAPEAPSAQPMSAAFVTWWNTALMNGGFESKVASAAPNVRASGLTVTGSAPQSGSGSFDLVAFSHVFIGDGRYANVPWAQETPDPMTGHTWDTWVLVNPEDAAALGVKDNDLVTLKSDNGSINVGVEVYPYVNKGTVAVPFGNGHSGNGRYADGVGQNPVDLLSADGSGWQQAKVAISATGQTATLISTFGGDTDEDRNLAVRVDAATLAKHGDAPAHHPGEMTGIHHLPMDARLVERGITNFYEMPQHPNYRFGMSVDLNACNGCGACSIACYAENNLPVVGKKKVSEGREMGWIRINRYYSTSEDQDVVFMPMMCQHCGHAPCESVCPVLATYHSLDGLNAMVYNRCVGTRYCSNACPYSVRKFNYHSYTWPEPFNLQLNPEVVTRTMGVMEKCTFCVQRIRDVKSAYRDAGFNNKVPDQVLEQLPACAEVCPSQALSFGNLNNEDSAPSKGRKSGRNFEALAELNVMPAVQYLAKGSFHHNPSHHGGGHSDDHAADDGHNDHTEKQPAHGAEAH